MPADYLEHAPRLSPCPRWAGSAERDTRIVFAFRGPSSSDWWQIETFGLGTVVVVVDVVVVVVDVVVVVVVLVVVGGGGGRVVREISWPKTATPENG